MISAEIEPVPKQANRAALVLQRLGFRILHIGATISVQGPQGLWESTFNVSFEPKEKTTLAAIEGSEVSYQQASVEQMRLPAELRDLITGVAFAEPPEFYRSVADKT